MTESTTATRRPKTVEKLCEVIKKLIPGDLTVLGGKIYDHYDQ